MIEISEIESGGLGARAGLRPGDRIVRINDQEIGDVIDFQVHSSDAHLDIDVERDGEGYELQIERVPGELMGITFEEMTLRRCNNRCVFCFLHQMPGGMRRSLYFEDDDYRLSFLHGSYVTLTNVKDEHIERIIDQGLTPQYISVHATDPELRQVMLGRKKPTVPILERIARLAANGIEMHAQVVVCPGWNDGAHLETTVGDLGSFYPQVRSVAIVPVGLTRFRSHLPELKPVTRELAAQILEQAEAWGEAFSRDFGERFVYPADEFFLLTRRTPPGRASYDAFPQIENGVGMVRSFLDTWERQKGQLAALASAAQPVEIALVTGVLASAFLEPIAAELSALSGLRAEAAVVANEFFGTGITVSGLLTGRDIAGRLSGGKWDVAVLPPNCINGEGLTLDDLTVAELSQECGVPLTVGDYDLASFVAAYMADPRATLEGRGRQLSELGFSIGGVREEA